MGARCSTCHSEYRHGTPFTHRTGCAQMGRASTEATMVMRAPVAKADSITPKVKGSGKARCVLGHIHDSTGEATACSPIHTAAAHAGLTVFRPGRPGIPCFCVAPDESGRPCFVSIDWVLVNDKRKIVGLLDWKAKKSQRMIYGGDSAFPRGKRIIEQETGCRVVELKELSDIGPAVNNAGVGAGHAPGKQGPGEAGSIPGAPVNLDTHAAGAAGRE